MSSEAATQHKILPLRTYLIVAGCLIALTGITVEVSFINLGGWNAVAAVFIAAIKASLVALFFMHLKYDKKINAMIFMTAILFFALFLSLTFFDVLSRGDIYTEVENPIRKNSAMYDSLKVDTTAVEHGEPAPDEGHGH